MNDPELSDRFSLIKELIALRGNIPTQKVINHLITLYETNKCKEDYDILLFYINLIIDLLRERNDEKLL